MSGLIFIKAEFTGINWERGRGMRYYWECGKCGKEYQTGVIPKAEFCEECRNKEYARKVKEKQELAEQKIYKKVIAKMKKEFDSQIPFITLNGEKYYLAKSLERMISSKE